MALRNTTTISANGFGLRFARVYLARPRRSIFEDMSNLRTVARRAIRRNLLASGELGTGYRVRISQLSVAFNDDGLVTSVLFSEKTD